MDEEYDFAYEDELDAMRELEDDPPISRKSLNFNTPSSRSKQASEVLDTSLPTPFDSPLPKLDLDEEGIRKRTKLDRPHDECSPVKEPEKKKQRTDREDFDYSEMFTEVEDFEITPPPSPPRLLRGRKSQKNKHLDIFDELNSLLQRQQDVLVEDYDFERPRVLTRIPDGDYISATGGEGQRVYMGLKNDDEFKNNVDESVRRDRVSHLLGVPFDDLKLEAMKLKQDKIIAESERITAMLDREFDMETGLEDDGGEGKDMEKEYEQNLWVTKYTPKGYRELLSDESTNRTLLGWLKQWDYVVFGKDKKDKKVKEAKKEGNKNQFQKKQAELMEELDQFDRPHYKVALLSGQPGLGKTTLAHVIAKHAGYQVVEMNASDDRSVEAFKNKIDSATQYKAFLDSERRPNCLVIDEIDGAPQAAINILINTIKRSGDTAGKKKKKDGGILLRPIICICNDQYVPALRPLRQLAMLFHFPPTQPTKLASRLYDISRREAIRCDLTALMQLCQKTDNDIRSCLNTLQFLKNQDRDLSAATFQSLSIGQKDGHKSLYSIWQEIFHMPRLKRQRFVNPHDRPKDGVLLDEDLAAWNQNNTSLTARFHNVLQTVHETDDNEKLVQGLYENYLEMKFKDPRFEGVNLANEWLCFNDLINQEVLHHQNWTIAKYLAYLPVTFHLIFATSAFPKIQYPSSSYENHLKYQKSVNLVTALTNDMSPFVRGHLNLQTTVLDVLPPLMDIIQPSLRPVNTQLYSGREKEELANLIRTMIAYNLTYIQEKDEDGQYTYLLEPNMELVVRYPGMKQHKSLTYAAKQLIGREIDIEKMRRSEAILNKNTDSTAAVQNSDKFKKPGKGTKTSNQVPNHLKQKLEPVAITPQAEKPQLDFFGRVIVKKKTPEALKKDESRDLLNTIIWFRFKEGYSNAVRRPVKMQDLL